MNIKLMKAMDGSLRPINEESEEFVRKLKVGQIIHADFKRMRDYEKHKKWFALVTYAYEHWEPSNLEDPKWKQVIPEKNFDQFRKDVTIMAGYYVANYRLDGSVRIEAQSISFANMSDEVFLKLYSNTIDVVLKHVLKNYTEDELERVLIEVMSFT